MSSVRFSRANLRCAAKIGAKQYPVDVNTSPALIDYVQALLAASRVDAEIRVGLSPRAGLALLNAARANALLDGRAYCLPEDVQAVFVAAAAHRITPGGASHLGRDQLAQRLLESTPVR